MSIDVAKMVIWPAPPFGPAVAGIRGEGVSRERVEKKGNSANRAETPQSYS